MKNKDQKLLSCLKESDKDSFRELFLKYHQSLFNFVLYRLKDKVITDDIVQETFLRVWNHRNSKIIMFIFSVIAGISFLLVILGVNSFQFIFPVIVILLVPIIVTYYGKYDEESSTKGLTVYSINEAKQSFKGSKINEKLGEKVEVKLQLSNHNEDEIMVSKNDLLKLGAEVGDLVYLSDKRKWLGGLKSIHSRFGKSHNEDGIVYLNENQIDHGLFENDKILIAEKEM